ncbi:MAG: bifunctional diaminohydroxyphosphoribosylaminopyrimidine deaminase/5-amino-6-(5-phosphoribosylamino)uracil reductase RibD [Rhizobiales bacterium]|nr:bifunctional diaminohydroxyphosphoribosylaminopyrimidine deaminase/5-amino-6-(5-phosphoribosylamino)uracil reductase RibD [Hyphomicrobiales bacterium]
MRRPSDEALMSAAIALARRGLGRTWPNPSVAALVVDDSVDPPIMLGRGITAPGGRPHAEANAVMAAGSAARDATMIVTLEPCAQRSQRVFGPSCTEIILESGIRRVVIGASDPSPFASGEGAQRLREAGLEVVTGVLETEAHAVTLGHCLRVAKNRPFITLKLAQTADGFAGTSDRRSLVITGDETRAFVHGLRARHDAILTGIGTVLADDPRLDVRLPGMEDMSPLRVVLDTEGRMPTEARMLSNRFAKTLILSAKPQNLHLTRNDQNIEIIAIPPDGSGRLDLQAALGALAAMGVTRLMVEAGPTLAETLAEAALIDEFVLLTGPARAGNGLPAIGPSLAQWREKAQLTRSRKVGGDLCEIFEAQR